MSTPSFTNPKSSKALHIALWIMQVLLAGMFLMAGFMKLTTPIDQLGSQMAWVKDMPALVRFIEAAEVLGGLGLLLPSILRIKPILTPLAALGIATIMLLAAIYHLSRGETSAIGINFILGAIALFVFWGRTKKAPIRAKGFQG